MVLMQGWQCCWSLMAGMAEKVLQEGLAGTAVFPMRCVSASGSLVAPASPASTSIPHTQQTRRTERRAAAAPASVYVQCVCEDTHGAMCVCEQRVICSAGREWWRKEKGE